MIDQKNDFVQQDDSSTITLMPVAARRREISLATENGAKRDAVVYTVYSVRGSEGGPYILITEELFVSMVSELSELRETVADGSGGWDDD